MATSCTILSSSLLPTRVLTANPQTQQLHPAPRRRPSSFRVQAAKLPVGVPSLAGNASLKSTSVVVPKVEPKLKAPFAGFTRTAEIWNSRACMIGLIGTFIVELILNKGILQLIGVEIGKGLDIPL